MRDLCRLIGWTVVDLLRSRARLEAEIWTLRQQINVLRQAAPKKLSFSPIDQLIFVGLYRLFPCPFHIFHPVFDSCGEGESGHYSM